MEQDTAWREEQERKEGGGEGRVEVCVSRSPFLSSSCAVRRSLTRDGTQFTYYGGFEAGRRPHVAAADWPLSRAERVQRLIGLFSAELDAVEADKLETAQLQREAALAAGDAVGAEQRELRCQLGALRAELAAVRGQLATMADHLEVARAASAVAGTAPRATAGVAVQCGGTDTSVAADDDPASADAAVQTEVTASRVVVVPGPMLPPSGASVLRERIGEAVTAVLGMQSELAVPFDGEPRSGSSPGLEEEPTDLGCCSADVDIANSESDDAALYSHGDHGEPRAGSSPVGDTARRLPELERDQCVPTPSVDQGSRAPLGATGLCDSELEAVPPPPPPPSCGCCASPPHVTTKRRQRKWRRATRAGRADADLRDHRWARALLEAAAGLVQLSGAPSAGVGCFDQDELIDDLNTPLVMGPMITLGSRVLVRPLLMKGWLV